MSTRAHITLVVDRSGSMDKIREEAEAGLRKFIDEQAALDKVKVKFLLYQFDDTFEHVCGPVKAKDVWPYRIQPRAMTALFDAIGKSIVGTKAVVEAATEKGKAPDKVVVVIMTDGIENASHEHNLGSITNLIDEQKKAGWEFIFLAGTLGAVEVGRQSGLATRAYDPRKRGETYAVYAAASANTSAYLAGDAPTTDAEPDDTSKASEPSPASR